MTLIDEEKVASGEMSEEEFIKKYPRSARGQHTAELAALGLGTASAVTGMALANKGMNYVISNPEKAKRLTKGAWGAAGLSAASLAASAGIKHYKDKKAEKGKEDK